ncbi:hypothetical protein F4859DRAFT_343451 [Xylaria cf. heliscus]|nr:hypothetical protein F4859DRAFT_343451 [Xylaria cf. heliscus]
MTNLDEQYTKKDNPMRRAVDYLSQIPDFFSPTTAGAVAGAVSAAAAATATANTPAPILHSPFPRPPIPHSPFPLASIPHQPDRQAASQYKRICPALGFSTWTGRFLLGPEIERSRQSTQLLTNALKWYPRPVPTPLPQPSNRPRIPSTFVIPPNVTADFLRRLEKERLADYDDSSAAWEPGVFFTYQPRHVEKAIVVFATERELTHSRYEEQEAESPTDKRDRRRRRRREPERLPEIGRGRHVAETEQHHDEFTPPPMRNPRLSSSPEPEPEPEPTLAPEPGVEGGPEPLSTPQRPSPLAFLVESNDDANDHLGLGIISSESEARDDDDYHIHISDFNSSIDGELPGGSGRSLPLSIVAGRKRSRSMLEGRYGSNHDDEDGDDDDDEDASEPPRQHRVGAEDPTPGLEKASPIAKHAKPMFQESHGRNTDVAVPTPSSRTPTLDLELLNRAIGALKPGQWLNDDAINFAIHQLVTDSQVQSSFAVVPSHLSATIIQCSSSEAMDKLSQRYLRSQPILPHHLLIPVHWSNHWVLFHWQGPSSQLICFDSMRILQDAKLVSHTNLQLQSFLSQLHHHRHRMSGFIKDKVPCQPLMGDCPQQDNGFDCGTWVITNAYRIISSNSAMSSQKSIDILYRGPTTPDSSNHIRSFLAARFLTAPHVVPPSLFTSLDPDAEGILMRALLLRQFPNRHSDGQSGSANNGIRQYQTWMAAIIRFKEVSDSSSGGQFMERMYARMGLTGLAAGLARLYVTHSRNFEHLIKTREALSQYRRQRDFEQSCTRKMELLRTCASKLADVSLAVAAIQKHGEDMTVGMRIEGLTGVAVGGFEEFNLATESVKNGIVTLESNVRLALKLAPRFESKAQDKTTNTAHDENDKDKKQVLLETDVENARICATVSLLLIHRVAAVYTQEEARLRLLES